MSDVTPVQIRQIIVRRERRAKLLIVALILIGGLTILLAVPGMLISFLIAFVITYLFKPVVNYCERKGLNRTSSIIIPFVLTGLLITSVSSFFIPRMTQQAEAFQSELPKYVAGVSELVKKNTSKINKLIAPFSKVDMAEQAGQWLQSTSGSLLNNIPNWISQFLSTLLLAPFFAFFMLRDGQKISRSLLALVPNNLFEAALNLVYQINQQLGGFIRARLLEALIVGVVVWCGLYLLDFPYAALLSILAGATNLIPYVGPVIGAVPGLLVAVVNQQSSGSIALVGLVYVVAQAVDMLFIIPLVVAKIVDLHPVTVVIVIIVGSQVMGVLGMIISVPVASILKLTFTEFYNHVVDFRS